MLNLFNKKFKRKNKKRTNFSCQHFLELRLISKENLPNLKRQDV